MKRLIVFALAFSLSVPVFATPVASFTQTQSTQSSTISTQPATQQLAEILSAYELDTQIEFNHMMQLCSQLGIRQVSAYAYNSNLIISEAEYNTLYSQRMTSHNNGTNPLPVRFLPNDYDNGMTIANGTDRTVLYEIVLGYPIFYKIERYQRPETFTELNNLPNNNADKLDITSSGLNVTGKVGTLTLN